MGLRELLALCLAVLQEEQRDFRHLFDTVGFELLQFAQCAADRKHGLNRFEARFDRLVSGRDSFQAICSGDVTLLQA